MVTEYFFDTYALFEIIRGSDNYSNIDVVGLALTKYNLMELYYGLYKKHGFSIAEKYFDYFRDYCIDVDDNILKEAMIFKAEFENKGISYVDAIGYVVAKKQEIVFLTGDKAFEGMENVEFRK